MSDPFNTHPKLSREDCVKYGGHCWIDDGLRLSTGYSSSQRQMCRHCDYYRDGVSREPWEWTYPEKQG
jgi:hypothetical protein